MPKGRHTLVVRHSGDFGALPVVAYPNPGDSSTTARMVAKEWREEKLTLWIEGRSGTTPAIRVFTVKRPVQTEGSAGEEHEENGLTLKVQLPAGGKDKYVQKTAHITVESSENK